MIEVRAHLIADIAASVGAVLATAAAVADGAVTVPIGTLIAACVPLAGGLYALIVIAMRLSRHLTQMESTLSQSLQLLHETRTELKELRTEKAHAHERIDLEMRDLGERVAKLEGAS